MDIYKFFKQTKYKFFLLLIVLFSIIYSTKLHWEPYYNNLFTKYEYFHPAKGEDFVIGIEPFDYSHPPQFLHNILEIAFPDNKIIYSNNKKPNLIIRSEHIKTYQVKAKEYQKYNAPYITISSERYSIKPKRFRRNGLPIAEIVSATPKNSRQIYFPFMTWSGLKPEKIYTNNNRKKFLAYIASNCQPMRENLFAAIKKKNNHAQALGMCSNPNKTRFPGSWSELDKVYSNYNFMFAMENHAENGYITEKILNGFRSGAIPVYWGDTETVEKIFNPKSYINISKFKSLDEAAEYIINLNNNEDAIQKIRSEPIFKDNIIPEIFLINNKNNKSINNAANFIREKYFEQLDKNKIS